ncbi:hypothetical protein HMI55_001861 [Coelomomyces lativittatus]|nr:hypothetical protein HMI55_001861 [Coelomomyces lativittatus]
MEEKIQLTRQQYYQKSAMAEAGPKYTHHFLTLNGIVLHIEIIKSNKILVLTSKGFLELWMCSNGRQWTMTSCQLLSPRLPKLTCVKVMAPTPLEQHHLATNRVQYLKHHASSSANSFTEKNNLASKERQVDINSTDESLKQFTSETYYFGGSSTSSNVLKEAKSTHLYYVNLINWLSNPREVKTYLLGCINGEVYTYDIGVNENQQVYVKFLHKVQASVTPIKFITYFAPGHRVVLHSHQQDQNGQLTQGLSIFSIPRLDLIQHLPFDKLFSTIPEEVSQSEKETDLWLIPLSSLVADNIRMRLYIGLGCYLFEFMYRDLPLTNESTYTITKTNVAIEESSLEISETSNEDLQNTTEPSFLIELSNSLSLSFRARNLNNSLSNSLPQDTYLQFNMPEPILNEKTDNNHRTSPYTTAILVADKKSTEPSSDDSLAAYVESIKKGKEPALDLSTLEDVLLHPVYKITDRSPSLNTDHNMLNADIATLKANIFAIEKEIKLSFSNRREKAHESIKFHYQDLPSETALKLSNSASFASKSLSGQVNLKSLHGYEELLHRAKISLKQHQEMKGASSKSRVPICIYKKASS